MNQFHKTPSLFAFSARWKGSPNELLHFLRRGSDCEKGLVNRNGHYVHVHPRTCRHVTTHDSKKAKCVCLRWDWKPECPNLPSVCWVVRPTTRARAFYAPLYMMHPGVFPRELIGSTFQFSIVKTPWRQQRPAFHRVSSAIRETVATRRLPSL